MSTFRGRMLCFGYLYIWEVAPEMLLVSRCSIFSESFQVHFHMFDVFGASEGSLKTPCVYLIYFYEQINKSSSLKKKGMINIKYAPFPSPCPIQWNPRLVATCEALQASCSPTREAQPPRSAAACEEGLAALPHDATPQRVVIARKSTKPNRITIQVLGTAHPLSLSGKGPVIFKSSSTFPNMLWTRHHSFAIRSLDATWCHYDCNPRHPCKLNAPDSKTMGSSKKYSLCIAFQWHNSSHCPSNKTHPNRCTIKYNYIIM